MARNRYGPPLSRALAGPAITFRALRLARLARAQPLGGLVRRAPRLRYARLAYFGDPVTDLAPYGVACPVP